MDDRAEARPAARRARIFISYKRGAVPDEPIALQLFEVLGREHDVFIDQVSIPIGTRWAERIEEELRRADFMVPLLSAESFPSEMVQAEIETAHRLASERGGRPAILPVRLAHSQPFPYPLSAILNPLQHAFWEGPDDTPRLLDLLGHAVALGRLDSSGQPVEESGAHDGPGQPDVPPGLQPPSTSAQPLETPEGTMDPVSPYYVERTVDRIALDVITRAGVTITIKGPRQVGKSSLLIRTRDAAVAAGKVVAFLDFQLFDRAALNDADRFFREFCAWLADDLGLDDRIDEFWRPSLSNSMRCTRYLSRYLLPALGRPLTLAMDEVESIFDTEFRSDFFGMLRSWHNQRRPGSPWKGLDLVLVTSTEPYQLIENLNQSPFNVGEVLDLNDLTTEQVADLNRRHGSPLSTDQERLLGGLLGGHPYLVRRALYLVASGRISIDDLFAQATDDRGPFGDHLRNHLYRLHDRPDLIRELQQVIRTHARTDERLFWKLQGAGLVRKTGGAEVPRCRLYADYFRERLHG